jgi:hypothetical protein
MTELEVLLLDAVKSALRVHELRGRYTRAGPLTRKEARTRLTREERFFNQLASRALAKVDEQISKGKD